MKIISTAFTCEKDRGSEYEVGYKWSLILGNILETLTLTRKSSYLSLKAFEINHPIYGLVKKINNTYYKSIDLPFIHKLLKGRKYMRIHYIAWIFITTLWIRINKDKFDINHHICFVSTWLPPLTFFGGLPFIWGPIGTGSPLPKWALSNNLYSLIWQIVTQILPSKNLLIKYIASRSQFTIPINSHVENLLGLKIKNSLKSYKTKSFIFPSIAIDKKESKIFHNQYKPINTCKIIWSGRNVPFKLPELVVETIKILKIKYPKIELTLIGEGMDFYNDNNLKIRFLKTIPQKEFFKKISVSNILLTPTTEGAGFVSLEALSFGVPIVCLENSGASEFIGKDGGISCPILKSQFKTAKSLVHACEELVKSQEIWESYREAAYLRHFEYSWKNLEKNLKLHYKKSFNI